MNRRGFLSISAAALIVRPSAPRLPLLRHAATCQWKFNDMQCLAGLSKEEIEARRDSWLTAQEAIRMAFKYRNRSHTPGLTGERWPILITDFNPVYLRIMEVTPGDWDDWKTWRVSERPMTESEREYLTQWQAEPKACREIGCVIPVSDGKYKTQAYIKRPGAFNDEWTISLNVDQVNNTMDYGD